MITTYKICSRARNRKNARWHITTTINWSVDDALKAWLVAPREKYEYQVRTANGRVLFHEQMLDEDIDSMLLNLKRMEQSEEFKKAFKKQRAKQMLEW